jgi:hypothetical protein
MTNVQPNSNSQNPKNFIVPSLREGQKSDEAISSCHSQLDWESRNITNTLDSRFRPPRLGEAGGNDKYKRLFRRFAPRNDECNKNIGFGNWDFLFTL